MWGTGSEYDIKCNATAFTIISLRWATGLRPGLGSNHERLDKIILVHAWIEEYPTLNSVAIMSLWWHWDNNTKTTVIPWGSFAEHLFLVVLIVGAGGPLPSWFLAWWQTIVQTWTELNTDTRLLRSLHACMLWESQNECFILMVTQHEKHCLANKDIFITYLQT